MNRELQSDCDRCFGLCCVALPYAKSSDFAFNKEGGVPCSNLNQNHRCTIHAYLRDRGFKGCTTYECFGAGQHVSQNIFQGRDWRKEPALSKEMYAVFPVVQQLHEMLYYLSQAMEAKETEPIRDELQSVYEAVSALTHLPPKAILGLDVPAHREKVNRALMKTSELVRNNVVPGKQKNMVRKDLLGASLKGADLRGTNFRGAMMIASDLRGADLRYSDFIGADLRDADLSGANLTGSIFLTQAQVNSARGNRHTSLPHDVKVPEHWQ